MKYASLPDYDEEKGKDEAFGPRRGKVARVADTVSTVALDVFSRGPSRACCAVLGLLLALLSLGVLIGLEISSPSLAMCDLFWRSTGGSLNGRCVYVMQSMGKDRRYYKWHEARAQCENYGYELATDTEVEDTLEKGDMIFSGIWVQRSNRTGVPHKFYVGSGAQEADPGDSFSYYACSTPKRLRLSINTGWVSRMRWDLYKAALLRQDMLFVDSRSRGWREGRTKYWTSWEKIGEAARVHFEMWQRGEIEDPGRKEYLESLIPKDHAKREL